MYSSQGNELNCVVVNEVSFTSISLGSQEPVVYIFQLLLLQLGLASVRYGSICTLLFMRVPLRRPGLTWTVTIMLPVWKGVIAGRFHSTESGVIWLGGSVAD